MENVSLLPKPITNRSQLQDHTATTKILFSLRAIPYAKYFLHLSLFLTHVLLAYVFAVHESVGGASASKIITSTSLLPTAVSSCIQTFTIPRVEQSMNSLLCDPMFPVYVYGGQLVGSIVLFLALRCYSGYLTLLRWSCTMLELWWFVAVAEEFSLLGDSFLRAGRGLSFLQIVDGFHTSPLSLAMLLVLLWSTMEGLNVLVVAVLGVVPLSLGTGFNYCPLCGDPWIIEKFKKEHECVEGDARDYLRNYGTVTPKVKFVAHHPKNIGEDAVGAVSRYSYSWLGSFVKCGWNSRSFIVFDNLPKLPRRLRTAPMVLEVDQALGEWCGGKLPIGKSPMNVPQDAREALSSGRYSGFQSILPPSNLRFSLLRRAIIYLRLVKEESSFWLIFWNFRGVRMIFLFGAKWLNDIMATVVPVTLGYLVKYIKTPSASVEQGLWYCFIVTGALLAQNLCYRWSVSKLENIGLETSCILRTLIFRKVIWIPQRLKRYGDDDIMSLISVDVKRVRVAVLGFHSVWGYPFSLMWSVLVLHAYIGWVSTGTTILAIAIVVKLNGKVKSLSSKEKKHLVEGTLARVTTLREAINSIDAVKSNAWERMFVSRILKARSMEYSGSHVLQRCKVLSSLLGDSTAIIVGPACFAVFYLCNGDATAATLITALGLINNLKSAMWSLPSEAGTLSSATTSINRIDEFLLQSNAVGFHCATVPRGTIRVVGATVPVSVAHGDKHTKMLYNVNFNAECGERIVVLGRSGGGKSSIIHTILGELAFVKSNQSAIVELNGSVGLCCEEPWIRHCSIRENIVCGRPFDEERYDSVCWACNLQSITDILDLGDEAIVGDVTTIFNREQKMIFSLCRALYGDPDIYLFENLWAHFSPKTRDVIVSRVFKTLLKNKTVVLFSSTMIPELEPDRLFIIHDTSLHMVNSAGVMSGNSNVSVSDFGISSAETIHTGPGPTDERMENEPVNDETNPLEDEAEGAVELFASSKSCVIDAVLNERPTKLFESTADKHPENVRGALSMYLENYWILFLVMFLACVGQAMQLGKDVWLAWWLNHKEVGMGTFLALYLGLGLVGNSLYAAKTIIGIKTNYKQATRIHNSVIERVFSAPLSFFTAVHPSSVISTLTKDQTVLDQDVPGTMDSLTETSVKLGVILFFNVSLNPAFLIILPFLVTLFHDVTVRYFVVLKKTNQLRDCKKGELLAFEREIIRGTLTIRTMELATFMEGQMSELQEQDHRISATASALRHWANFRLELVATTTVAFGFLLAVVFRGSLSPATAGIAVNSCMKFATALVPLIRKYSSIQSQIWSMERLYQLQQFTPAEKKLAVVLMADRAMWSEQLQIPTATPEIDKAPIVVVGQPQNRWSLVRSAVKLQGKFPSLRSKSPSLELIGVTARYANGKSMARISLNIPGGSWCAIIGLLHGGKHTLFRTLLRLMDHIEGQVLVSGADTDQLPLHVLRTYISYVPAFPIVFQGSWLMNITLRSTDGVKSVSEVCTKSEVEEVWKALKLVGLAALIEGHPNQLLSNPTGLTPEQLQLLYLSRAILRGARFILLDELADLHACLRVTQCIKSHFSHCTVMSITQHVETLEMATCAVVLDKGGAVVAEPSDSIVRGFLSKPKS